MFFDLQVIDANLGFATANGGGAFALVIPAPLSGVSGVTRFKSQILALDAVSVGIRGADGSLASTPVKVAEAAPVAVIRPPAPPVTIDAALVGSCAVQGSPFTVWGSGFKAGESTNIFLVTGSSADGAPVQSGVGSALANSRGAIRADITITADPGLYGIKAAGIRGTEASAPLAVLATGEKC